jgi:hypothetical protein
MSDLQSKSEPGGEVESALLDAELFVKYGAPERAIKRLRAALERSPRSVPVRERLREVAASHRHPEEAARQCLALASLYIEREDFETAHDRSRVGSNSACATAGSSTLRANKRQPLGYAAGDARRRSLCYQCL